MNNNNGVAGRRRRRGRGRARRRNRRGGGDQPVREQDSMGVTTILGPSRTVTLRYQDATEQRFGGANSYYCWAIKMTDVYDPDPLLATGGITGYAEMVAFYNSWIVEEFELEMRVTNRESYPLNVCVIPGPASLVAAITSIALAQDAFERPMAVKPYMLAAQGGMDGVTFKQKINVGRCLGDLRTYRDSGGYVGNVATSPPNNLYLNVVVIGVAMLAMNSGVFYSARYSYKTRFFNLKSALLGSAASWRVNVLMHEIRELCRSDATPTVKKQRKAELEGEIRKLYLIE